jgi:hypothetical protein
MTGRLASWNPKCTSAQLAQSKEFCLLGYVAMQSDVSQPTFRSNISLHAACFILVSCLAYSSSLKIGTICSSEKSVDFQRTARRHIPGHTGCSERRLMGY